jgi:hypothetical protein
VELRGAVVIHECRVAQPDLVAVMQDLRALHSYAVDPRAVHAAEIAQHHQRALLLDDAVLLADDRVEQLDHVVRMPPDTLMRREVDRLPALFGDVDESRHAPREYRSWSASITSAREDRP